MLIENEAIKEDEIASSATESVETFFNHRTDHDDNINIRQLRDNGYDKLLTYKLPYGKDEAWRFTNLKSYFFRIKNSKTNNGNLPSLDKLLKYVDDNCIKSYVVFVDGNYMPSLSDTTILSNGILIESFKTLDIKNDNINKMLMYIPDDKEFPRDSFGSNILTSLNMANVQDGLLLSVPADIKIEHTLQVIFWSSTGKDSMGKSTSYPRLLVDINEGAALKLKQTYISDNEVTEDTPSFIGGNTRITIKRGGKLVHTYVQELSESSRHAEVLSAQVDRESSYDVTIVQVGARIGRVNIHIDLIGEGANCSLSGVTLSNTKQSLDIHSSILHDSPSAMSRQQQRNVVGDRGEAIFKGRIRIPKHAQLTDSGQLCRTIMLGERARIIAMPTLEITADNVVCSHGASVQELDENELFYLATRGINKKEAKRLLLRSFCLELLNNFDVDKKAENRLIEKIDKMFTSSVSKE